MEEALEESVLGRLRDLWWKHFVESINSDGLEKTLNSLDSAMKLGNAEFRARAEKFAKMKGHDVNTSKYIQSVNQFLVFLA